jgi:glycosyltransferase involved in cell wall biosynthesis
MVETGGWGGIAHYTWNLCQALAQGGADVVLLTNTRFELNDLPRHFRVENCFAPDRNYLHTVRVFLRTLDRVAPEIVHVQSLLSSRFDAFLWPWIRRTAPLVMTAHNIRSHENSPWEAWTTWRSYRAADALVVHTDESAQIASHRLGPTHRVALIHHGDYAFFRPAQPLSRSEARHRLRLPVDVRLLLAFGAIRPYKGIQELFEALGIVRLRHPSTHLVVVGPLLVGTETEYRKAIERAGLFDAVTFRPEYVPHGEVASYFAAADIAVYNYSEVTDSGALRIACSLGTPVVATAVGAFREFLQDGVTGRLVPPHNPAVLTAAICDLLEDREAALRMATAARDLAVSRWSWQDSARQTIALYEALVTRETR